MNAAQIGYPLSMISTRSQLAPSRSERVDLGRLRLAHHPAGIFGTGKAWPRFGRKQALPQEARKPETLDAEISPTSGLEQGVPEIIAYDNEPLAWRHRGFDSKDDRRPRDLGMNAAPHNAFWLALISDRDRSARLLRLPAMSVGLKPAKPIGPSDRGFDPTEGGPRKVIEGS